MAHPIEPSLPDPAAHMAHIHRDFRAKPCSAADLHQLADWQQVALASLKTVLRLDQLRSQLADHEPDVHVINTIDCGSYTQEAAFLQAEPTVQLPVWVLRPKGKGPFPLCVTPHGHGEFGSYVGIADTPAKKQTLIDEDNDVAIQAVERGFFTIAMGTRGLGPGRQEQLSKHLKSACHRHWAMTLMAGRTAMAERVWDAMHLISWATSRNDVDESRVLMIGNSGGGQVTTYTAALDRRVSVAVPNCSFAPLISEQGDMSHCLCNLVPGIFTFGDYADVAALIAPRPLLFVHGRKDELFSEADVNRAVQPVAELYQRVGAADRFSHQWGDAGHRFYKHLHWPFVDRHMKP